MSLVTRGMGGGSLIGGGMGSGAAVAAPPLATPRTRRTTAGFPFQPVPPVVVYTERMHVALDGQWRVLVDDSVTTTAVTWVPFVPDVVSAILADTVFASTALTGTGPQSILWVSRDQLALMQEVGLSLAFNLDMLVRDRAWNPARRQQDLQALLLAEQGVAESEAVLERIQALDRLLGLDILAE